MFSTAERKNYAVMIVTIVLCIITAVSGQVNLPIVSTTEQPTESVINVQTVLGLVPDSFAEGPENSRKLNLAINSATYNKPFFFPGGDWYFGSDTTNANITGTCIETDDSSGWSFTSGAAGWRVVNDGSASTGPGAAQIIYAGPRVTIVPSGAVTASVLLASPTQVTVVGYDVKLQDVGGTLQITDGTNAIEDATLLFNAETCSFYVIVGIDDAANKWILDRACVSVGDCPALSALMTYTLWRDRGYANYYQGLHFKGHPDVGQSASIVSGNHSVTDAARATIVMNTYDVVGADVGATVWINGGTNAIQGYYTIVSVDATDTDDEGPDTESWTLNRNCTVGATTTLTGRMRYPRCHVGMHVITNDVNNDTGTTQDPLTGKHLYMGNSWSDFNVMNLCGKDLRKAFAKAPVNTITGEAFMDNHADHLNHVNSNAEHGMVFFYTRNRQSLGHTIRSQMYATNLYEAFCYIERGGHVLIDCMTVGGGRGPTLRVGIQTTNSGNNVVRELSHDANPNSAIPRMYAHDQSGTTDTPASVLFDGIHIDSDLANWTEPLFDCYSGDRLEIRNWERARPESIKMTRGGASNTTGNRPYVVVNGARANGLTTSPGEFKHGDSSADAYGTLKWLDIVNSSGNTTYVDNQIQDLIVP